MKAHAEHFTRACNLCVQYKASTQRRELLGVNPLPTRKLDTWEFDLVLGLPRASGFDGYLSIIELVTGFRIAIPIAKQVSAKTLIEHMKNYVIAMFGVPKLLKSDSGSNLLKSKDFGIFCTHYNIETHVYTPHSPKSHGRVEVSNRTITDLLSILTDQYSVPWPRILHWTILMLNSRPYSPWRRVTPYELMYGQRPTFNLEVINEKDSDTTAELCARIDDYLKSKAKDLKHNKALMPYEEGTFILVRDFSIVPSKKVKPKFKQVPLMVLRDMGQVLLVRTFSGSIVQIHKDNARRCHEREAEYYANLPMPVKLKLGNSFTQEELKQAMEIQEIPSFWRKQDVKFEKPITRRDTAQLEQENEEDLERLNQLTKLTTPRKVHFDL